MKPAEGSTVIGKSIRFTGELMGDEDLFLDGTFEGTIRLPKSRLTVGPNALVSAEIHVHDAVILGRVVGNISAAASVDLRQSANVAGDVSAGRLSIEESAVIKGRVELTSRGAQPTTGNSGTTHEKSGEVVASPQSRA